MVARCVCVRVRVLELLLKHQNRGQTGMTLPVKKIAPQGGTAESYVIGCLIVYYEMCCLCVPLASFLCCTLFAYK